MWWGIGILGFVLWLTLLVILCAATPRRGHWIMFLSGIPLPIFWAIGAIIPPTAKARAAGY